MPPVWFWWPVCSWRNRLAFSTADVFAKYESILLQTSLLAFLNNINQIIWISIQNKPKYQVIQPIILSINKKTINFYHIFLFPLLRLHFFLLLYFTFDLLLLSALYLYYMLRSSLLQTTLRFKYNNFNNWRRYFKNHPI